MVQVCQASSENIGEKVSGIAVQSAPLLSAGITTKSPTELEKEKAAHFHLPGRSHGQRSLEGLQTVGLQRVRLDLVTECSTDLQSAMFNLMEADRREDTNTSGIYI